MTTTSTPGVDYMSCEAQLSALSQEYDIPKSQIKAVYLRGVASFFESREAIGSPAIWGLARVQRFLRSTSSDTDLRASHTYSETPSHVDLTSETPSFVPDVIYSSGDMIRTYFYPCQVTDIAVSDTWILVSGVLDELTWTYALDVTSGDQTLEVL